MHLAKFSCWLGSACSAGRTLTSPLKRRMAQAVIDKAADFVRCCQSNGTQPMICSEFVYRAYDEAVPGADNPYNIEITEFWSAASRRRILGWRRRGQPVAVSSMIPPESLLGTILAQHGSLDAVLELPKTLAAAAPAISDEELDTIIEACLSEPTGTKAKMMLADGPAVEMDDLRRPVGNFAAALHARSVSSGCSWQSPVSGRG